MQYDTRIEYKEYFTQIDLIVGNSEEFKRYSRFLDMKYRMFGQAVSKIDDCIGLCDVMKAFDPRSKGYFMRISTGGFRFKGE
jgi:hypothetical protein